MNYNYLIASLVGIVLPHLSMAQELSLQELPGVLADMNELVLRIDKGDEIPVEFILGGDMISMKQSPENGLVTALQTFYIKLDPQFLFSKDRGEWHSFDKFFTGNLGVSLSATDESPDPTGEISFILEKR
ncbi:MAG: hypothetical protein K1060chlam2_00120 [Chlamydiae bacterium]|nr:hypothetical protein [Chlamydiota bacterium]